MTSQPELDLPPIAAAVLEEQGVDSLSYVLRLCHHGLALWQFRRWLHGPAMQCHAGDDLRDDIIMVAGEVTTQTTIAY